VSGAKAELGGATRYTDSRMVWSHASLNYGLRFLDVIGSCPPDVAAAKDGGNRGMAPARRRS
jgi:hypothetical protein